MFIEPTHLIFIEGESTLDNEGTKEQSEIDQDDLLENDEIMIAEEEQDITENLAYDLYELK